MSLIKIARLTQKTLLSSIQTPQLRSIHQASPRYFNEPAKKTTSLTQRSASLRPFSTEVNKNEEKESSAPDVQTTLLGVIGGLGYIYVTQSIISYFFEQQ